MQTSKLHLRHRLLFCCFEQHCLTLTAWQKLQSVMVNKKCSYSSPEWMPDSGIASVWHCQSHCQKDLNLVHKLHLRHELLFCCFEQHRLLSTAGRNCSLSWPSVLILFKSPRQEGTLHSVLFNLHSQQISTMDRAEHSKQYLYLYYLT